MRTNNDKVKAYLKELAEVSKRHGLFIESCDCCSEIVDANGNRVEKLDRIGYDEETDSY